MGLDQRNLLQPSRELQWFHRVSRIPLSPKTSVTLDKRLRKRKKQERRRRTRNLQTQKSDGSRPLERRNWCPRLSTRPPRGLPDPPQIVAPTRPTKASIFQRQPNWPINHLPPHQILRREGAHASILRPFRVQDPM